MKTRQRLVGLVLAALMAGATLLASCSSPSSGGTAPSTSTAPTTAPAPSGTPTPIKPSGKLTVALAFGAGSLDPIQASARGFGNQAAAIFDSLLYIDPDNKAAPSIAERWEIAPNGLSQTYYIRKGIKFHNGDPLTGADVKFSIERSQATENIHMDAAAWRASIASVELKDDYTVVVQMKTPQFELLKGEGTGGMAAVLPKKYIEEKGIEYFRKNPVGSGSWKFVKYDPGNRLDLEANESHWRVVPRFQELTLINSPTEATLVAMLKTGEIDLAEVAPDSVAGLKSAGVKMLSFDGDAQYFGWPFFDNQEPQKYAFGDVRVRKALQLAINSKEIADAMFGGNGGPYALFYVSPSAYFYDANVLKMDPFDPEGAKKLLAEAGYANGFETKIFDTRPGLLSQVIEATAGYWRKVGVKAEIVNMEYSTFYAKLAPNPKPELWQTVWMLGSGAFRGFDGLLTGYHSKRGVPKNINNLTLDELIEKVPMTKDPAEKKKLALEAARFAQQEYNTFRIVGVHTNLAVSSKIKELPVSRSTTVVTGFLETLKNAK